MQQLFTNPETIFHRLTGSFPDKSISKDNIYEWCFDAEVNYICNENDMVLYDNAELEIDSISRKAVLPCNVFRLVNVYDCENNPLKYTLLPPSYIKLDCQEEKVFVSYYGLGVDDDGAPYVPSNHIPALETFCQINIIKPDAIALKYPYNIWKDMKQTFSNQVIAIKQSWARRDHQFSNRMDAINFNMLPLAARRRLLHKYYD